MRRRLLLLGAAASPWGALAQVPQSEAPHPIEWPVIELLDGSALDAASWQGHAAVVVFWATHCAFCERHNAHVDKLHRATRGQPLRVLGVALDSDPDAVRHYMAAHHYGFPVALDGGRLRQRLTARRVIPMTCVVDGQGRLVQAIPGEMTEDDVLGLAGLALRPANLHGILDGLRPRRNQELT